MAELEHISSILPTVLGQLFKAWEQEKKEDQIEKDNQAHPVDADQG